MFLTILASSTRYALIILSFKAPALNTPPYALETVLLDLVNFLNCYGLTLFKPFNKTLLYESVQAVADVLLLGY